MKLLIFLLIAYGISNILVFGSIFKSWRNFWSNVNPNFFGTLFTCMICLPTYVGFFGSLLMIGKNSAQHWRTTIFSMLSGVACANYITPIILDMAKMDIKYQVSVGFVLGFLGLRSVEVIGKKLIKEDKNGSKSNNQSNS